MKKNFSSIPFIPAKNSDIEKALPGEILMDPETGNIYLDKESKELLEAFKERLLNDDNISIITPEQGTEYGIAIDFNEADPSASITYTEDSFGFKPIELKNGVCDYGSWEDIIKDFFGVQPVLIKNGEVIAELDDYNYNHILDSEYNTNVIFGFKLNFDTGEFIYTDDAEGFIKATLDKDEGFNPGSWEEVITKLIGAKAVALDSEGNWLYDLDPYDYRVKASQESADNFDIMIRFKHLYYYMDINKDGITFKISNYKVDDTFVDTIFNNKSEMYISAYDASKDISGNYVSRPDKILDITIVPNYYSEEVMHKYLYLLCLTIMINGSFDFSTLGIVGSDEYIKTTGTLDEIGLFGTDGDKTKLFGMENIFGNCCVLSSSVYANGAQFRYHIEPVDEDAEITRVIRIRSNDVSMDSNKTNFIIGYKDVAIDMCVPMRLFR